MIDRRVVGGRDGNWGKVNSGQKLTRKEIPVSESGSEQVTAGQRHCDLSQRKNGNEAEHTSLLLLLPVSDTATQTPIGP